MEEARKSPSAEDWSFERDGDRWVLRCFGAAVLRDLRHADDVVFAADHTIDLAATKVRMRVSEMKATGCVARDADGRQIVVDLESYEGDSVVSPDGKSAILSEYEGQIVAEDEEDDGPFFLLQE